MEGQSQSNELNRSQAWRDLAVKAAKTKTCSSKAAGSAYNEIMKEVNSLNDEFDMPPSIMDSQIFATLVRKSREALEKEMGFWPFDAQ